MRTANCTDVYSMFEHKEKYDCFSNRIFSKVLNVWGFMVALNLSQSLCKIMFSVTFGFEYTLCPSEYSKGRLYRTYKNPYRGYIHFS